MPTPLYRYWGKSLKPWESTPQRAVYHPAICHMLDVAAVAQALLESTGDAARRLLLASLQCPEAQEIPWLCFIVSLHDLGKISPGFQAKAPDLVDCLIPAEDKKQFPFAKNDERDHGRITLDTVPAILQERSACNGTVALELARAVAAHHGSYHQTGDQKSPGKAGWDAARREAVEILREAFKLDWLDFPLRETPAPSFFLLLAGLTSVADWLGSDEKHFPYLGDAWTQKGFSLDSYFQERLRTARTRVADLNLHAPSFAPQAHVFGDLFQFDGQPAAPNPVQTAALRIAGQLPAGPALVIVETPMGSGKTEAALALADRWLSAGTADGIYYALPTQATANAMLSRLLDFLQRITDKTQLHLLHAYADLQDEYRALMGKELKQPDIADIHDDENSKKKDKNKDVGEEHEGEGTVRAASWFTARKRGLLSPFAVGTVDQALLAVLKQARHLFVRLFGLAGKVVVIDEAHAYDTYTSTLLENLLRWLAALETPVVLLSATLPERKRRDLLKAYAPRAALPEGVHYPCLLAAHREAETALYEPVELEQSKFFQLHIRTASGDQRWVTVEELLRAQLQDGGCALCVINTVVEAQALFQHLQGCGAFADGELHLFHARFPLGQRLKIEAQVKDLFGKYPKNRPTRAVLVATQVVEQSLDVDFDVLITELAPIDLILQRMGRVHRHNNKDRPARLREATVYCLLPDLTVAKPDFGFSAFYSPEILLKSALLVQALPEHLGHAQGIRLPEDVQKLIGLVYGPDEIKVPEHLICFADESYVVQHSKDRYAARFADTAALPDEFADCEMFFYTLRGDLQNRPTFEDEVLLAKTRLTEESITLIVLHADAQGRTYLDVNSTQAVDLSAQPDKAQTQVLMRHGVTVSNKACYEHFVKEKPPKGWEKSPLLRYCRAAVFRDGELSYANGKVLRLDEKLGLVLPESRKLNG